ncbi:hypothetical protein JL720_16660 [Aureococcus anophagefferens]|nr:hypothetical protein JL720_16660 [Aureococcus anophagefferens]
MVATCSAEKEQTEESISTCRFAQRVALVKNDAHVNEETDPFVTIRRLKGEVATLRAEVYVDSRDAHETLRVSPLTLTRIKDCFAILKNMVLSAMATAGPGGGGGGGGGDCDALQRTLKERDNEIAILVNMVRQAKGGGPLPTLGKDQTSPGKPARRRTPKPDRAGPERRDPGNLPPKEAAGIRDDPQKAYAYFRERCRTNGAIEDNKAVLKAKYGEAKMYGERVNSSRKSIAYLKQTIEQLRRERAMEGVSGDDDDGEPPPPTAEEEKKKEAIEVEKRVYKESFEKLRGLKGEIEHIQRMLETGRARLQSDFDKWYDHVLRIPINSPRYDHEAVARARAVRLGDAALNASQPKPPKLTGNEDADDDIRAFYAARRSSPCSRRSANDGRSLGCAEGAVVVGGARRVDGRAIPRALERGERGDERGDAGDAERRRAREVVVDLFRGRDLSVATAANVADSPASAAAVASSESKSDAVSAAMSASTVSVVVESVAIV